MLGFIAFVGALRTLAQGIVHVNYSGYLTPATIDLNGDGQADFSVNWSGVFIGTTYIPQSFSTSSWNLAALILIRFQDETKHYRVLAWQEHVG